MTDTDQQTSHIKEKQSLKLNFTIIDEDGNPITLANLNALTVTVWNKDTAAIINSRTNVDIKNANGGFFHATDGTGYWVMTPADAAVSSSLAYEAEELHVVLFQYTYNTTKRGSQEHYVYVERVRNLTP